MTEPRMINVTINFPNGEKANVWMEDPSLREALERWADRLWPDRSSLVIVLPVVNPPHCGPSATPAPDA